MSARQHAGGPQRREHVQQRRRRRSGRCGCRARRRARMSSSAATSCSCPCAAGASTPPAGARAVADASQAAFGRANRLTSTRRRAAVARHLVELGVGEQEDAAPLRDAVHRHVEPLGLLEHRLEAARALGARDLDPVLRAVGEAPGRVGQLVQVARAAAPSTRARVARLHAGDHTTRRRCGDAVNPGSDPGFGVDPRVRPLGEARVVRAQVELAAVAALAGHAVLGARAAAERVLGELQPHHPARGALREAEAPAELDPDWSA